MTWTTLWDMHSGGGTKEPPYEEFYIEAPVKEAKSIFYARFGHSPDRVSCTCCGPDYSVYEHESLEQASGYHRGCASGYFYEDDSTETTIDNRGVFDKNIQQWVHDGRPIVFKYVENPDYSRVKYGRSRAYCEERYLTVDEYKTQDNVCVINADDIKDHERATAVPEQGFVWVD